MLQFVANLLHMLSLGQLHHRLPFWFLNHSRLRGGQAAHSKSAFFISVNLMHTKPYTAPKLWDRMASELAYERILADDLRAQMETPHYSLTSEERQGLSELYDLIQKKVVLLEKIIKFERFPATDHTFSSESDTGNHDGFVKDMAEMGMLAYATLTSGQKLRMQAMMYVNKTHGAIKVTPNTLHLLPEEIRNEVRAFLHVVLGENPMATQMIVEVLRPPKRLRNK